MIEQFYINQCFNWLHYWCAKIANILMTI